MTTVVIADDNEEIRRAIKKLLKNYDIVGEAADGDSALKLAKQTNPNLIILDLSMPKRPGLSIIPEIKQQSADIKILVFTIRISPKDAREAFDVGADGYCIKDEGSKGLLSAINDVLNGKRYISSVLGYLYANEGDSD